MRILYHHRTRAEDAQGVHIQAITRAFRQLGHDVEMVSLIDAASSDGAGARGWSAKLTRHVPISVYEAMSLAYNLYGYRQLSHALRRRGADLIYERYALNTVCGIWASRRFGIPLILEVNSPLYYEQQQLGALAFRRLALRSERWVCSNSTRTIVVSKVMADLLEQEGVPAEHIVVVPNGIDPTEFHPEISGEPVRQRHNLQGRIVVGFAGWFRAWHGLDRLVEAMHRVGLLERGVRLLLVGDGPAAPQLRHYVTTHGLTSAVVLTGPVDRGEMPGYIAAMDIAVQPNANEYACPMKILEYMGLARCIVAPDQPNIREILDDGVTALLFQKDAPESLILKLHEAIDDPAKRNRIGRRAHEMIYERGFLWRCNAERALQYAQLTAPARPPFEQRQAASSVHGRE